MSDKYILFCIAIMAGVTYLIRAVPLTLLRRRLKNRFIKSFLHYIPFAVLAAMTVPGIFYATGSYASAAAGLAVAVLLSVLNGKLIVVAVCASGAVYITELVMSLM